MAAQTQTRGTDYLVALAVDPHQQRTYNDSQYMSGVRFRLGLRRLATRAKTRVLVASRNPVISPVKTGIGGWACYRQN
jgi:hypothetical protein